MTSSDKVSYPDGRDYGLAVLIALLVLAIYVRTLAPDVLYSDSAEFQTLAYTLGTSHSTGYSVYLLLARVVGFLPLRSPAWRISLFSALCAAVTVGGDLLAGPFRDAQSDRGSVGECIAGTLVYLLVSSYHCRSLCAGNSVFGGDYGAVGVLAARPFRASPRVVFCHSFDVPGIGYSCFGSVDCSDGGLVCTLGSLVTASGAVAALSKCRQRRIRCRIELLFPDLHSLGLSQSDLQFCPGDAVSVTFNLGITSIRPG